MTPFERLAWIAGQLVRGALLGFAALAAFEILAHGIVGCCGPGTWDLIWGTLAYYGPWILLGLAVGVILWAWWRTTGRRSK